MKDEGAKHGGYVSQAWLVILLALVYGAALAGVQTTLAPKIAENKRNETYDVIPTLISGADGTKTVELTVVGTDGKEQQVYRAFAADGSFKGWVLSAGGQGFAGRIDLLIGLDPQLATITGLYVLDQKETPGLGNLITGQGFRNQFAGMSTDNPLLVVKSDSPAGSNEIRAISGATISSDSVAAIVNAAVANLKEPIRQTRLAPESTPGSAPRGRGG